MLPQGAVAGCRRRMLLQGACVRLLFVLWSLLPGAERVPAKVLLSELEGAGGGLGC